MQFPLVFNKFDIPCYMHASSQRGALHHSWLDFSSFHWNLSRQTTFNREIKEMKKKSLTQHTDRHCQQFSMRASSRNSGSLAVPLTCRDCVVAGASFCCKYKGERKISKHQNYWKVITNLFVDVTLNYRKHHRGNSINVKHSFHPDIRYTGKLRVKGFFSLIKISNMKNTVEIDTKEQINQNHCAHFSYLNFRESTMWANVSQWLANEIHVFIHLYFNVMFVNNFYGNNQMHKK